MQAYTHDPREAVDKAVDQGNRHIITFLWHFLWKHSTGYRLFMIIVIVMIVLKAIAELQGAIILEFLSDKLVSPHEDPENSFYLALLNLIDPLAPGKVHSARTVVLFLAAMLVVFSIIFAVLTYVQSYLTTKIGHLLTGHLRKLLFDQLQRLTLDWHGQQKKGDLIQRITGDITNIEKLIVDGLADLLGGIVTPILAIWLLWQTQYQLTLISLVLLPALLVIILLYTRGIQAAAKRAIHAMGELAGAAMEDVGSITALKAFSLEEREAMRFNRYVGKSEEAGMQAGMLQAQFTPIVVVLVSLGIGIVIAMGALALINGKFPLLNITASPPVTLGMLLLFFEYLKLLYNPMRELSKVTNTTANAAAGAVRIQEIFDQAPEIIDSAVSYTGPQKLKGEIAFESVVFGYNPDWPVLKSINLHITAGEKVALVGLSGSGKTTLVKLIPRFYEVQQGAVKIDSIDNRRYPLSVLRRNVSQVLQDSVLFEGTILENIKIGRLEATMEEVENAAKQAQIHETILSWPDGYNTKVRERGKNLSGGQRQRLAIARAILSDAPILILDEPTVNLDAQSESEVLRAVDQLIVGRTVLLISHRLSTLGNVDKVVVMQDGRIVEQGPYQQLKRQGGAFARLLKEQNRYNIDYFGNSLIVSKNELMRPLNEQKPAMPASPQAIQPPQQQGLAVLPASPNAEFAPTVQPERASLAGNDESRQTAQPTNARILVEVNGQVVSERQLDKPMLTIGRLKNNDVPVPSQRISRLHAKICWENGVWVIEDAGSLYGLLYQGSRIERLVLSKGMRIQLSPDVVLQFESL